MRIAWLVIIVGACILGVYSGLHPWGFLYALGVHPYPGPQTPWTYQMWSGIIPALSIVTIFGGVTGFFRHKNCHVDGCWRMGRFPAGQYTVCKPHHRQIVGVPTVEHITRHHVLHRRATLATAGFPATGSD